EDLFIYAKDVRQVLTYVESGNADVGFVYECDAETSDQVEVLATADSVNIDSIVYPGGVTAYSTNKSEAEAFLIFLQTEEVQDVLDKYGFVSRYEGRVTCQKRIFFHFGFACVQQGYRQ